MEDFKKRLLEFIERQYGMSQREFERMCDLAQGTISSIKNQGPTTETLWKIANKCPELNLNWLVLGVGNMLNGEQLPESSKTEVHTTNNTMHGNVNVGGAEELIAELRADKARLQKDNDFLRSKYEEVWEMYKNTVAK